MSGTTAFIALGANLGDRRATFRDAIESLDAADGVRVVALSRLYETVPVGGPDGQGTYLNAAAALETSLPAEALLDLMQAIEARHQRTRTVHWGPRTLDLDLLFFGSAIIATPRLAVPHPQMHLRRFVLAPLADIAAEAVDPRTGAMVADLLAALPADDIDDVVAIEEDWR